MSINTDAKRYLSDVIGDGYKEWRNGDIILITAATGAGKSYFILHTYLKWAIEKQFKILYLVNRKILKEQLEDILSEINRENKREHGICAEDISDYISIRTYQSIENKLKNFFINRVQEDLNKFACVVCDECHYFYTDSNFNTGTEVSYSIIKDLFKGKIRIYISATMDKIKKWIQRDKRMKLDSFDLVYGEREVKEYSLKMNYEKITPQIVNNDDSLIEHISKRIRGTNEKWLVFVDNIDWGKEIKRKLLEAEGLKKEDIIFIDADYEESNEANEVVNEIVNYKKTKRRVVISTAVMDNGITFSDEDLVNIAIFADTKETFLQMLGRRRGNNEEIQLYICKRSKEHFLRRLQYMEQILQCYKRYEKELNTLYCDNLLCLNQKEYWYAHQKILNVILSNNYSKEFMQKICCAYMGCIKYNPFSIERCEDLKLYYENLVIKLENDENAFLKQQAEWLGISDDILNQAIIEFEEDLFTKNRNILETEIKKIIVSQQGKLTEEENKKWKIKIRKSLEFFIEKAEQEGEAIKGSKGIGKSDRTLTEEIFNFCMTYAKLPYLMEKSLQKEGTYCTITQKDQ